MDILTIRDRSPSPSPGITTVATGRFQPAGLPPAGSAASVAALALDLDDHGDRVPRTDKFLSMTTVESYGEPGQRISSRLWRSIESADEIGAGITLSSAAPDKRDAASISALREQSPPNRARCHANCATFSVGGKGVMAGSRKLAAILVADVVGYSRLAGADEERILGRLRALRSDLIDPTIALHHGRVVKRTGDGALVEFRSVVDATRCAIEVQNSMLERNAGLPQERRIEFRIGIHLGDVVEESDGDLMGDGVNIAARLEGIAEPGAVCLSEDAYRQVKARLDLLVSDLGEKQLKNITEPMRVYAIRVGGAVHTKQPLPVTVSAHDARAWARSDKASIAVLPFTNMSGDPEQEYFTDGISEDIITDLSKLSQLHVIARNSSFVYKRSAVSNSGGG
jgi:class 3 adenylate cyclase